MYIGQRYQTNQPTIAKGFLLSDGTKFTVVGRCGAGYVIQLHNKIRRELVVGPSFFTIAKANKYDC